MYCLFYGSLLKALLNLYRDVFYAREISVPVVYKDNGVILVNPTETITIPPHRF